MTRTDKLVLEKLPRGARTLPELSQATGIATAALKASLDALVSDGLVIACAHTQTYWIRQPGSMVVRAA